MISAVLLGWRRALKDGGRWSTRRWNGEGRRTKKPKKRGTERSRERGDKENTARKRKKKEAEGVFHPLTCSF